MCNLNKDTGPEEEKKEATMELELYRIKCEGLCNKSLDPEEIFTCIHTECKNDIKTYCNQCGQFEHKVNGNKHHIFDPSKRYVKSVTRLYNPDQTAFAVKSIYYHP